MRFFAFGKKICGSGLISNLISFRLEIWVIIIYLFVYNLHYEAPVFNQTDSIWNTPTAISIVNNGDLNLNEYSDIFPIALNVNLWKSKGNYYNYYPYGLSILSAFPVLFIKYYYKWFMNKDIEDKFRTSSIRLDKNIASFFMAISSCIVFLISFKITQNYINSIFLSIVFAFGTIAFSGTSRGLWQHNGTFFLYFAIIYILLNNSDFAVLKLQGESKKVFGFSLHQIGIILSAFPLYFSYLVRPTSLVPIFFISVAIVLCLKKNFIFFFIIGFSTLAIFFATNYSIFGTLNHPYYDFDKVSSTDTFLEALLGNLISPGRGMFIYSPFLIFSIYGIYLKYKNENLRFYEIAFILIIIFHWIIISRNKNWWGGHSYGYRLMSDILPFMFYYFIYYWKYERFKIIKFAALLAVLISFYMNIFGAIYMNSYTWNLLPVNIDDFPERNWNWSDPPFLRR